MTCKNVRPARMKARIIIVVCVTSSRRRLSTRSAITPPNRVKNRNGIAPAKPTTPSQNAELVRVSTSHPWATFCIHVPMLDRKLPPQKSRKLGLRSERSTAGQRSDKTSEHMPGDCCIPATSSGSNGAVDSPASSINPVARSGSNSLRNALQSVVPPDPWKLSHKRQETRQASNEARDQSESQINAEAAKVNVKPLLV